MLYSWEVTKKEFIIPLSGDNQCRVVFLNEKGLVLGFTVQQEALIEEEWQPILRYDTTHGFIHRDVIHPDGTLQKQLLHFPRYNEALSAAIADVKLKHRFYRGRYEQWLRKHQQ